MRLFVLQHRKYVTGWVFEPGDIRAHVGLKAARDAFGVGTGASACVVVVLELDAEAIELGNGSVDVGDDEVEHGVAGRLVVILEVDKDLSSAGKLEVQAHGLVGELETKRFDIKFLGLGLVVNGKTAKGRLWLKHCIFPCSLAVLSHTMPRYACA